MELKNRIVYIGPYEISIKYVEGLDDITDGEWLFKNNTIQVDKNFGNGLDIGRVLFHEFLHAHFDIFGHNTLGKNEEIMEKLDSFYLSLFDPRNKEFIKDLEKLYTEKTKINNK